MCGFDLGVLREKRVNNRTLPRWVLGDPSELRAILLSLLCQSAAAVALMLALQGQYRALQCSSTASLPRRALKRYLDQVTLFRLQEHVLARSVIRVEVVRCGLRVIRFGSHFRVFLLYLYIVWIRDRRSCLVALYW